MSQSKGSEESAREGPQTPESRATTFQAVQGEHEHYSGEVLLVSAYALVWVVLFAWLALLWRKQNAVDGRLAELEREIAKADGKKSP